MNSNWLDKLKSFFNEQLQGTTNNPVLGSVLNYPHSADCDNEAIVEQVIQPGKQGRVWFQASWWPARCDQEITLSPNTIVYVVGRRNLTLLVQPTPSTLVAPKETRRHLVNSL